MGDERTRVLEIILEIDPDDADTRNHLIDTYRKEGVELRLVEHLMELRVRGDDRDDLAAEVIELLAKVRRLEEAAELAEACEARWGDQFRFSYLRAGIAFSRGNLDEADAVARRAGGIASVEEGEKVRPLLRKIQSALDDRELSLLEQRVKDEPGEPAPRLDFLRRLVRKGRLERAVVEADEFLRGIPAARDVLKAELREMIGGDGKPYLMAEFLAEQLLADGEWDAVHDLYGAMAKSSFSPAATLRTGAERILGLDADHRPSHLRLYEVSLEAGDPVTATSHVRRYLELGGELDFDQRAGLFAAYCEMEDLPHGEPLGLALIEEQPYAVGRICALAQLYIANQSFPEALTWLSRAKRVEPGNSAIYHLIDIARKKQRERRSLELRESIDKNPDDAVQLNELADLLVEFKRYDDALRYYQRAAQATDDDTQRLVCMTRLAWCMTKRGMFDTAIETLSEVPMKVTEDRKGLSDRKRLIYEIAEILENNNHFEDAVRLYKGVFKVDAGFRHVMEKVTRLAK
jgi:tetratricopeptide (TPR) repeat protein